MRVQRYFSFLITTTPHSTLNTESLNSKINQIKNMSVGQGYYLNIRSSLVYFDIQFNNVFVVEVLYIQSPEIFVCGVRVIII